MREICQRCKEEGEDRRTLWMACNYDMSELDMPFEKGEIAEDNFFTLRVCKACRALWMISIRNWFGDYDESLKSCDSGIFVRILGYNFEVSEEEFREMHPGREPVRMKKDN
jgi:hypothetical protein